MRWNLLLLVLFVFIACQLPGEKIGSSYKGKVKAKDPWAGKEFPVNDIGTSWQPATSDPNWELANPIKYPEIIIHKSVKGGVDTRQDYHSPLLKPGSHGHATFLCDVLEYTHGPDPDNKNNNIYKLHYWIPRHADRSFVTGDLMYHDLGYIAPVVLKKVENGVTTYYMWITKVQKAYDTSPGQDNFLDQFDYTYDTICLTSNNGIEWKTEITRKYGLEQAQSISKGGIIVFDVIEDNGSDLLWYLGKAEPSDKDEGWRLYSATWSEVKTRWIVDSNSKPFLLKDIEAVGFDTKSISKGSGILDPADGTYKLWYGGSDGVNEKIGLAFSSNGEVSAVKAMEPAIFNGTAKQFDSVAVTDPFVMKTGELYKMWYSGYNGTNWKIGLAYSWDGGNFSYHNSDYKAVIPNKDQSQDADYRYPFVMQEGDKYIMWYSKRDAGQELWKIEMMTSSQIK